MASQNNIDSGHTNPAYDGLEQHNNINSINHDAKNNKDNIAMKYETDTAGEGTVNSIDRKKTEEDDSEKKKEKVEQVGLLELVIIL